ncbi:MAG: hypothetical protein ACE15F_01095 [bacterium]
MSDFQQPFRLVFSAWAGWLALILFSLPGQAKEIPSLAALDQNGVKIECVPDLMPMVKQLHPWYTGQLKKYPENLNTDIQQLIKNQEKIVAFLTQQLALAQPSDFMKNDMPKVMAKYLEVGNPAPDLRHLQIWRRDDLKAFLDGGGSIPGYRYIPGSSGDNQLIMEKSITFSEKGETKKSAVDAPLLPVILKNDKPEDDLEAAKTFLTEALNNIPQMPPIMAATCLQTQLEMVIRENLYPSLCLIRWFSAGLGGYLTWMSLKNYVSENAAQIYLETQSTQPFEGKKHLVRLVQWIGEEPKSATDQTSSSMAAGVLQRVRYAFATYEIMELVKRHNPDIIPKLFAEVRKHAPSEEELKAAAQPDGKISGKIVIRDLNVILDAIQSVTGEDFRPRLLQYSPVPAPIEKPAEPAAKSAPEKKPEKKPAKPPSKPKKN